MQTWRTVRVFISSTFRDMHAERDYLVRAVFPELKERCRKRHVQLVDVDLRWGVTEEQAVGGGALDICLDEIDSCRPYFLGLLGYRYGYIPPGHDYSITAEEVYHGVLHNNLPRQLIDLRPFVEGILEGRALFKEQVSCLVGCYQWNPEKRKYLLQQGISPEDEKTLRSIFDVYSIYQRDRSFFFFRAESLTREMAGFNINDYFEADEGKLTRLKQEIIAAGLPYFEYDNLETFGQKVLETLWERIDAEFPEKREEIELDWLKEEAEFHELFMTDRTRRFVGRSDILGRMRTFAEDDSDPSLMVIMGEPGCGKSALLARFTEEVIHRHPDWLILSHFVGASPSSTSLRRMLRRLCAQLNHILGVEAEIPEEYKELAQLFPELLQKASQTRRLLLVIDALNQLERTDNAHILRWLPQKLPESVKIVVSILAGDTLDALKSWRIQPRFEELAGLTESEIREFVESYLKEIRKEFPTPHIRDVFYDKVKAGNPLYILVALEELRVFPVYEEVGKRVARLPDTVPELFSQVLERVEDDFSRPLVQDFTSFIACGRQGMTGEELQTLLKKHATVVNPDTPPAKLPDMLFSRLRRAFSAYLFERSGVIDFFHGQLKEAVGKRYLAEETDRDKVHQIIADYFENRWTEPYLRAIDELPHQLTKSKDWGGVECILCDLHFIEAKCAAGMTYELVADYDRLGVGRAFPGPPIRTPWGWNGRIGVQCPLCLTWGSIVKSQFGKLITCKSCQMRIKINPFAIEAKWPLAGPFEDASKRSKAKKAHFSKALGDFADFVCSQAYVLTSYPELTFQEASNQPDKADTARVARKKWESGKETRPWVEWRNKPQQKLPRIMTLSRPSPLIPSISAYSSSGDKIVCVTFDEKLRVWDARTGAELANSSGTWSAKYFDTNDRDKSGFAERLADNNPKIWDKETGGELATVTGSGMGSTIFSYSPDGRRIVARSDFFGQPPFGVQNLETLKVFNAETREEMKTLSGHSSRVNAYLFSPDGTRIVSASDDKTLITWDVETGHQLNTLTGHKEGVNGCAYSPDGRRIVSASDDKTLIVWDAQTGKELFKLIGHKNGAHYCAYSPDGKKVISTSIMDSELVVWDAEQGSQVGEPEGHSNEVIFCAQSSDGKRIMSGSLDGKLKLWNAKTGIVIATYKERLGHANAFAFSPDGRRAILACANNKLDIRTWDEATGWKLVKEIALFKDELQIFKEPFWKADSVSCAYSPDGRFVVLAAARTLMILDAETHETTATLGGGTNEYFKSLAGRGNYVGHRTEVVDCIFSADGRTVISRAEDGEVKIWDAKTGAELATLSDWSESWLRGGKTISMDSLCGKRILLSEEEIFRDIKVWDVKKKEELKFLDTEDEALASSSDGSVFVTGSQMGALKAWDAQAGTVLATFGIQNTGDKFTRLAFSAAAVGENGHDIVTGDESGRIYIFRLLGAKLPTPIVTPVRLWLFGVAGVPGRWSKEISVLCKRCLRRFPPNRMTVDVIRAIVRDANLSPDQSPCLELPDEAWEKPRLVSECPLCHKPLKFNPFIVDNRERY